MRDSSILASSTELTGSSDDLPALPIWAFTLGLLSLLTLGLTSIPAIVCGHRALVETRQANSASLARSVAVAGLVIGYVGVAILGVWIVAFARLLFSN